MAAWTGNTPADTYDEGLHRDSADGRIALGDNTLLPLVMATGTGGATAFGGTLSIGGNVVSDLLFTDATYDIGASGATRPRDLFLSRNAVIGGTLGVTGLATFASTLLINGRGAAKTLNVPVGNNAIATTGTPSFSEADTNSPAWALDDGATEGITVTFQVPADYVSGGVIHLIYRMATATSGVVAWFVQAVSLEEGQAYDNSGAANVTVDDTVQGTAVNLGFVAFTPATTYAPNDMVALTILRLGADGDDTASGDAWLAGCQFRYIADH